MYFLDLFTTSTGRSTSSSLVPKKPMQSAGFIVPTTIVNLSVGVTCSLFQPLTMSVFIIKSKHLSNVKFASIVTLADKNASGLDVILF